MFADYFREMGSEVLETAYGWASYKFMNDSCYIENIYVKPEYRKRKEASFIADKITKMAKEKGCKTLLGSTNTKNPSVERSIQVILGYGFKYLSSNEDSIWYYKEI